MTPSFEQDDSSSGVKTKRPPNSLDKPRPGCRGFSLPRPSAVPTRTLGTAASANYLIYWQEWRDSNPQPPVLETGALAIELHSYIKDLAAAYTVMLPSLLPKSVI